MMDSDARATERTNERAQQTEQQNEKEQTIIRINGKHSNQYKEMIMVKREWREKKKSRCKKTGYTVYARFVHQKYQTCVCVCVFESLVQRTRNAADFLWAQCDQKQKPDLNKHSPFFYCCCCFYCCMLSIFWLECSFGFWLFSSPNFDKLEWIRWE